MRPDLKGITEASIVYHRYTIHHTLLSLMSCNLFYFSPKPVRIFFFQVMKANAVLYPRKRIGDLPGWLMDCAFTPFVSFVQRLI